MNTENGRRKRAGSSGPRKRAGFSGPFLLYSALVANALFAFPFTTDGMLKPKVWLLQAVAACCVLMVLWYGRKPAVKNGPVCYLSAFVGWSVLSGSIRLCSTGAMELNLHLFSEKILVTIALLVVFVTARAFRLTPGQRLHLACLAGLTALVLATVGIAQFTGHDIFPGPLRSSRMRVFSLAGNPNYLAGSLACLVPLSLYGALGGGWLRKLAGGAVVGTSVVCLLLTRSRGGWLAFAAAILIVSLMWMKWREKKLPGNTDGVGGKPAGSLNTASSSSRRWLKVVTTIVLPMLVGVLLTTVLWGGNLRLGERVRSAFDSGSQNIQKRLLMWNLAWSITCDHPVIGVGPGGIQEHYLNYQKRYFSKGHEDRRKVSATPSHIHNDYLEIAAETGFPGIILFMAFLVSCVAGAFGLIPPRDGLWRLALAGSAAACLTHALVSFPLNLPAHAGLLFLSLGLLSGNGAAGGCPRPPRRRWKLTSGRGLLTVGILLITGVYLAAAGVLAAGDVHVRSALDRLSEGETKVAAGYLDRAGRLDPYDARIPYYRAQAAAQDKDSGRALDLYTRSLSLQSNYLAHYNRGVLYQNRGLWHKARDEYETALGLYPRFGEAAYLLGHVLEHLVELDEAHLAWTRASRDSRSPVIEADYRLGVLAQRRGQKEAAVKHYNSYIYACYKEIKTIQKDVTRLMGGPPTDASSLDDAPPEVLRLLRRQNILMKTMQQGANYLHSQGIEPPPFFKYPPPSIKKF